MSTISRDPIWHQDISVLWRKWDQFFPRATQTTAERINSIVRFMLYTSIALFAYNRKFKYVLFALLSAGVVTYMYDGTVATMPDDAFELKDATECVKPTKDNPFGNFMLTDNPARPPACGYEEVKDQTRAAFNEGLFRNADDIYERENSQRQFYRMPVTTSIPNTKAFADFLYGHHVSCKEKAVMCTGYN